MTVQEIVCQVCHSRQPNAWDCVVCGRPLHERPTLQGLMSPTLPDLEPTVLDEGGDVAVQRLPELELTALAGVDGRSVSVAPVVVEGLEQTRLEGADAALSSPTFFDPNLVIEPTPLAEAEAPVPRGQVVCRYCSTPWRDGSSRFCARCGMRVS